MTPDEHATIGDHSTYWRGLLDEGRAVVPRPRGRRRVGLTRSLTT